jgi:excisionase family DNA binding protein
MQNKNQYLTTVEISKILDITPVAVQKWISGGRLKAYRVGGNYRIWPKDLLQYLKDRGNSDYAMKEFEYDIKFYLTEKALGEAKTPEEVKALREKDPKMFDDVLLNSKLSLPGNIVGAISGKDKDPFTKHPFEDSEKAKKYINEANTPEEKTKRVAEVKNYEEGKCDKPWNEAGK